MEEVEQICSRIMIMDGGRALAQGTNDELKRMISMGEQVTVEVGDLAPAALEDIRALPHVLTAELATGQLVCSCEASPHNLVDVLDALRSAGAAVGRVWSEPPTLNDVFLEDHRPRAARPGQLCSTPSLSRSRRCCVGRARGSQILRSRLPRCSRSRLRTELRRWHRG